MKPQPIQRKRTKGFKLPPNTVCVNRPGKWGNPVKLVGDQIYIHAGYRRKILDPWVLLCIGDELAVVSIFRYILGIRASLYYTKNRRGYKGSLLRDPDILYWKKQFATYDITELTGKNLACFCPLYKPCHRESLLELANKID